MMNEEFSFGGGGGWRLEASYLRLPEIFFCEARPAIVRRPRLVVFNHDLADRLGLDGKVLDSEEGAQVLAGNLLPPGSRPFAQAYAGHQFGHFTVLGDGRAVVLGEQVAPDGIRFDIQMKGSGQTPYSRKGDGKAALGPMLREYLVSEAMAALGIPTTRSLAVVATGEPVYREEVLDGAVLVRVASSHIRVGTFEWAALSGEKKDLEALLDYAVWRHYPEVGGMGGKAREFFLRVRDRQAALVAQWMGVGFIHGVMNTDNMAICGETIDYGPCAFMDEYDPATVFSSIDRGGRYAYGNQPRVAQWNLARLAEAMLPVFDEVEEAALEFAREAVGGFEKVFVGEWHGLLQRKVGILSPEDGDGDLMKRLLDEMRVRRLDWTNTFRGLIGVLEGGESPLGEGWTSDWLKRLARQGVPNEDVMVMMRAVNPEVIPRNHLVEEALAAATRRGDMGPFYRLLDILRKPRQKPPEEYLRPMPGGSANYRTFCGT